MQDAARPVQRPTQGVPPAAVDLAERAKQAQQELERLARAAPTFSQKARGRMPEAMPIRQSLTASRAATAEKDRTARLKAFKEAQAAGLVPSDAHMLEGLRPARLARALSQRDLARISGINALTVTRIEGFINPPNRRTVWALARALEVEVDELYKPNPKIPAERGRRSLREKYRRILRGEGINNQRRLPRV